MKTSSARDDGERRAPIHPLLDAELEAWRVTWAEIMCREPVPSDPIFVSVSARPMTYFAAYAELEATMKALGIGYRGPHSLRRSFISWARAAKADREWIRWITHKRPRRDALDDYVFEDWDSLCEVTEKSCGSLARLLARPQNPPAKQIVPDTEVVSVKSQDAAIRSKSRNGTQGFGPTKTRKNNKPAARHGARQHAESPHALLGAAASLLSRRTLDPTGRASRAIAGLAQAICGRAA